MVWGHPRYGRLSRFADGGLKPADQERVARHLAKCARCREEVAVIRRVATVARALRMPTVSPAVLDDALARRWAGDRVLLPSSDPGAPEFTPRRVLSPVAALITLLVVAAMVSVGVLWADRPGPEATPADLGSGAVDTLGAGEAAPPAMLSLTPVQAAGDGAEGEAPAPDPGPESAQ
jgi:anti-sigma factor RsiW